MPSVVLHYLYLFIYLSILLMIYIHFQYVYIYLWQLKLHLLPHAVTLCFTYVDDDDGLQTGAEDGWVRYL